MSFKCSKCKQTSKPQEKMFKVSISTRRKTYRLKKGTSEGWETVAEAHYCFKCYERYLEDKKQSDKQNSILELQKQYK